MESSINTMFMRRLTGRDVLLPFGSEVRGIELKTLNVLIGPNGSGKSNLIEAVNYLRSAPREMRDITRKGGGVLARIWKGAPGDPATVECVTEYPKGRLGLKHTVAFRPAGQAFELENERIGEEKKRGADKDDVCFYYHRHPMVSTRGEAGRALAREPIEADRSILVRRRNPDLYPELAWLAEKYNWVRIYREWAGNAVFRESQRADMRTTWSKKTSRIWDCS